jgi:hypothetical protein
MSIKQDETMSPIPQEMIHGDSGGVLFIARAQELGTRPAGVQNTLGLLLV